MKIVIETIPHEQHRYPTVGDYWVDPDGTVQVRVSEMPDVRHAQLVALHELFELFLVQNDGVTMEAIDDFDTKWEAAQEYEETKSRFYEPGDDPAAPYHRQHVVAGVVERLAAHQLGVVWDDYADVIDGLG